MWFYVCLLVKVALIIYTNRSRKQIDNKEQVLLTIDVDTCNNVEVNYDVPIHRYLYLENA